MHSPDQAGLSIHLGVVVVITDPYRKICEDMHGVQPWGTKGYKYIGEFLQFVYELRCRTLLDYGCGQATIAAHLSGISDLVISNYDPAIPKYSDMPLPADMVICTDVLEHVERDLVPDVLAHIHELTLKGAYFSIGLTKAKLNLPDGRNAHITLEPAEWWMDQINRFAWVDVDFNIGKKSLRAHLRKG